MTVTALTMISDTERHLLAGDREEMNELAGACAIDATAIALNRELNGIQPGSYLGIDLEVLYVWDVNESGKTATVERGMVGSIASAHDSGSLVYVNPKFSKYDILNALNMEIRDVSTPPNGLWQVKEFTTTTQPISSLYQVPALNTDLIDVLEVRWIEPTAEQRWNRIWNESISVMRNMPTAGQGAVPSGMALRIEPPVRWWPGRPMTVKYAAPFNELVSLTDDAVAVTGLPPTAVDIPPLGAAARLMGVREAKRAFVESEVDTRRAGEVPPGSATRAATTLIGLLNARIRSEYMRLVRQYPQMR